MSGGSPPNSRPERPGAKTMPASAYGRAAPAPGFGRDWPRPSTDRGPATIDWLKIETSRPGRRPDEEEHDGAREMPAAWARAGRTKVKYVNDDGPIRLAAPAPPFCSQAVQATVRPRASPESLPKRIFRRRDRFPSGMIGASPATQRGRAAPDGQGPSSEPSTRWPGRCGRAAAGREHAERAQDAVVRSRNETPQRTGAPPGSPVIDMMPLNACMSAS